MGNPAEELIALFDAWQGSNGDVYTAREGANPGDLDFWREQRRAVELIGEIEERLDELEEIDAAAWWPTVPNWYRAAYLPDNAWSSQFRNSVYSTSDRALLHSLAVLLRSQQRSGRRLPAEQQATVKASVEAAIALLNGPEGRALEVGERVYVLDLLSGVRRVFEEKAVIGSVDLRRQIDQMNGALASAAARLTDAGDPAAGKKLAGAMFAIVGTMRNVLYDAAAAAALVSTGVDLFSIES